MEERKQAKGGERESQKRELEEKGKHIKVHDKERGSDTGQMREVVAEGGEEDQERDPGREEWSEKEVMGEGSETSTRG